MENEKIYFVFTDTGTNLSKVINYCTKKPLNHVSIAFDIELNKLYSFGRKHPKNPFSGGFVQEDIRSQFLRDSNCAVYSFHISKQEYERILISIKKIEKRQNDYRYNFLGLLGILFRIKIKRKRAFFCSQFVATMLRNADSIHLSKPSYFITPSDLRSQLNMNLIYKGKLGDYRIDSITTEKKLIKEDTLARQSFIFFITQKVKQFVIR